MNPVRNGQTASGEDVLAEADPGARLPVYGRDAELGQVEDVLSSVAAGDGRILLIEGEAGIGKSHLVHAGGVRASTGGIHVVRGAADELEQDRPGRILAGVADEIRARCDPDVAKTDLPLGDPAYAVVEAFVDAVEDQTAQRPLVMLVEDLHWADTLSVRGLAAIARRVRSVPLGLIATMRPVPRPGHLQQLLEICHHAQAQTVRLAGLDGNAVADLVESLTAARPGPSLRSQLDGAAGNPLFVIELIYGLEHEGVLTVDGGVAETTAASVPHSLAQTLTRRLTSLPDDTVQLLRLASLLGGQFTLGDLAVVAGRSVVDVESHMRHAVDAAFVIDEGTHLAFRHDLIRDAVYLQTPAAIRHELHVAAGRALAGAGAPSQQVARQFAVGARPGDLVAVTWLLTAAREAVAVDTATAAMLQEQALELAPEDWDERASVEATLVELLAWSGRVDDARILAEILLGRSLTPNEELQARRAYGTVLGAVGDLDGAAEQLSAAASLADTPAPEQDVLRCAAAGMSVISGRSTATARATVATIADTTDSAVACWVQHTIGVAAVSEGVYDEALDAFLRSRALLDAGYVAPLGFLIPHIWVATGYYQMDRTSQTQTAITAARRRAERRGDVGLLLHTTAADALIAWVDGRWNDATTQAEAALALADETGTQAQTVLIHSVLALVALGRGDRKTAQQHLDRANAIVESGAFHLFGVDMLLWARALLLEDHGETDRALALLDPFWDQAANLRGLIQWRHVGPDLVRLCRAGGDVERAKEVAADMTTIAARSTSPSAAAAARRGRGLADGDPDTLIDAANGMRSTRRVIDTAATCTEAGALLLDHGRSEEGRALLEEATAIYHRVGADGHLTRVDAMLGRSTAPQVRTRPTTPTFGWASLSPKEHEVIDLVTEGLSNPQIGERLFISRRTVESHLSHIFRKLDLTNRTQLATAATQRARD